MWEGKGAGGWDKDKGSWGKGAGGGWDKERGSWGKGLGVICQKEKDSVRLLVHQTDCQIGRGRWGREGSREGFLIQVVS